MQALSLVFGRRTPYAILILVCVVLSSCGWEQKISFSSPSGKRHLEVWQPRVENVSGMELRLREGSGSRLIYKSPGEAYVYFAEAFWTKDERQVAILVVGTSSYPLAYDLSIRKLIPFDRLKNGIAEQIAKDYQRPRKDEAIDWASTNEAWDQFRRLHPTAVSY